MRTSKLSIRNLLGDTRILVTWLCLCGLGLPHTALAATRPIQNPGKQILASSSADSVRFSSMGELLQLRLEVINSAGEIVYDSGFKSGNILDWPLADQQGQRLTFNTYLCLVTVKDSTGQMTRKLALAKLGEQGVSLQPAARSSLSAVQVEAVGQESGEENGLTILEAGGSAATSVLGHDGNTAHLVSGRGGLTFSSGDFFANQLREHMRLTEAGNLGIGTVNPLARLDVDGLIHTTQGIVFPDGTIQTTAALAGQSYQKTGEKPEGSIARVGKTGKAGKAGKDDQSVSPELNVNEDLTINGNIIFTPPSQGFVRDINMQNNNFGLRFYGAPTLTASPAAAAIQFWGNNSPFPGQLYLDSGAHDNGAVIIRSTGTGGAITERMRVAASGNVGMGTSVPLGRLQVVTTSDAAPSNIPIWDARHFVIGGTMNTGAIGFSYDQTNQVGYIQALSPNTAWRNLVLQSGGGNVGMGILNPSAKLSVVSAGSTEINGAAMSSTFRTTAGTLGTTAGDELSLASIGFLAGSGNNSSLGIRGRRITAGNSWTTTAIGLGMDVDNTVRAGDATVWLHANGNVGIGQSNPTAKLTVEGTVQSNTGGFKFPDGSVQTTAANTTFTTAIFYPNGQLELTFSGFPNQSILHLNLPTGTYQLLATFELANGAHYDFQDNTRSVACRFSGEQYSLLNIASNAHQIVTMHSVMSISSGGVDLFCQGFGIDQDRVFAETRRLTAVKIEGNVIVQ